MILRAYAMHDRARHSMALKSTAERSMSEHGVALRSEALHHKALQRKAWQRTAAQNTALGFLEGKWIVFERSGPVWNRGSISSFLGSLDCWSSLGSPRSFLTEAL